MATWRFGETVSQRVLNISYRQIRNSLVKFIGAKKGVPIRLSEEGSYQATPHISLNSLGQGFAVNWRTDVE
jgi:hypothetical protein